ncbi:MAG: AI-2E family transporter [Sneathiellaceae bacterium]
MLTASAFGILLIVVTASLYYGRDFFLPIVLAVLFGLVLRPIVRGLAKRHVPPGLSAAVLVLGLVLGGGAGAYYLSGPVTEWIDSAPQIGRELKWKLSDLRESVEAVKRASEEVEEAAGGTDDPRVQQVIMKEPGLLSRMATGLPAVVAEAVLCVVLLLFLLSSGDMFLEKMVRVLPTMRDKVQMLRIARDVEGEISHYLLTVTAINFCLGCAIAAGMAVIGMPNPYLWGLAAALLNFLPYLGSIVGIVMVTAVALVSYQSLASAALAPAIYLALTSLEGQVVTPLILGRRLRLNPIAIFIAVAFWAFLWGIAGAFIAVPLLIIAKVVSDHSRTLAPLSEFLSGRAGPGEENHRRH